MKKNNTNRKCPISKRSGAALVEFAICVPVVFVLFFASFDICRFSMITHAAEQAAFEGARRGSIPGATAAEAKQAAQDELDKLSLKNATITVTPNTIYNSTEKVTVNVRLSLEANSWVPTKVLTGGYIDRTSTLTREYVTSD
ncbi:MAG TPA: transporter [Planctomycetaceae bacterium]|nr:transporter [Rubinisphaera sp.]HCS51249.1 transporter [Planctomycetaceae bacterium]